MANLRVNLDTAIFSTLNVAAVTNEASRQDFQIDATLTVPYDQSILQTDRVVHPSGTYEVQSVDAGKSWASSKICLMRRL